MGWLFLFIFRISCVGTDAKVAALKSWKPSSTRHFSLGTRYQASENSRNLVPLLTRMVLNMFNDKKC
jgi:hypothetical protein